MNPGRKISAGGVLYRTGGKAPEVVLISTRGGKVWGLPKGLQEEGENLAFTAHREVKEETGLDGKIIKNLGHIEYFFTFRHEDRSEKIFKIVYFFLMECTGGDMTAHDEEVEEVRWFPIDEAIKVLKFDDEKGIVRKARKELRRLE